MGTVNQSPLQCEVIPYRDRLPAAISPLWEQIAVDDQTPLFLRPEWLAMGIDTGAIGRGFVLVFCDGDRPRALLPFQYRTHWSAEISAPLAPDYMPLIVAPGGEEAIWPALAAWFRRSNLALLRIGRYPPDRFAQLLALTRQQGLTPITRQMEYTYCATLPDSWDAYIRVLSKKTRQLVRHGEERIRADYPDMRVVVSERPEDCDAAMTELIRLSRLRWQHERRRSFLENPHMAALLRQFTRWAVETGAGCTVTMRIDGRVVAVATGIHVPGQPDAFYHAVGRDPHALSSKHSPGIALACHVIRWAIARGARRLSLGQGSMPYKMTLGGVQSAQWDLCIAKSPAGAFVMKRLDPAIRLARLRMMRIVQQWP